jgi:RNA-directed DNA polymerase
MQTYTNLYSKLCSYDNLILAWKKARKRKTLKNYVIDFGSNLDENLKQLKHELETLTYSPAPLTTFIVKDPKTRRISASHFRDRVVHHAICNIAQSIFEKDFIYDSFANQKNKGTHGAIKRAKHFMRKVKMPENIVQGRGQLLLRKRNRNSYALKADIRHYFDTVDREILLVRQEYHDF